MTRRPQELAFDSPAYLGLRHASADLRPWPSLIPEPGSESSRLVASIARQLAELQGCESGALARSTLHLYWDLFGVLSSKSTSLYVDEGIYPIARSGMDRARALHSRVRTFPHFDPETLVRLLRRDRRSPIVVTDGLCTACARVAPVPEYLAATRSRGGMIVVDNTQPIGILGHSPTEELPYGVGGGGVLQWANVRSPHVMLISSLAKGFGVPMASLCGSAARIRLFESHSETQRHCTPPTAADYHAALHALSVNDLRGDRLRAILFDRVRWFRASLVQVHINSRGVDFPVQTVLTGTGRHARATYARLLGHGIRAVLARNPAGEPCGITFLITASHRRADIERAVQTLACRS